MLTFGLHTVWRGAALAQTVEKHGAVAGQTEIKFGAGQPGKEDVTENSHHDLRAEKPLEGQVRFVSGVGGVTDVRRERFEGGCRAEQLHVQTLTISQHQIKHVPQSSTSCTPPKTPHQLISVFPSKQQPLDRLALLGETCY